MPIIAYQSFNSNSSTSHGLDSLRFQHFTKLTNESVTKKGQQALVLPSDPNNLTMAIEGPADLMDIEPLTDSQPVTAFGGQISLVGQNLKRALGGMPDILVLGEMDSSHSDFKTISSDKDVKYEHVKTERANQSFTAIIPVQNNMWISRICHDEGYVIYNVFKFGVAFVHVPNNIAKDETKVANFYSNIYNKVVQEGGTLDLVIGDTNQTNSDFTVGVLSSLYPKDKYVNAAPSGNIELVDNYKNSVSGTNSTGSKMYDVAVYRSARVKLTAGPAYISQSSGGITVTDHCGIGVNIELV